MNFTWYILILLFGIASYAVGLRQMWQGVYSPSTFSRVVWLLLAINSFAGVVVSGGTTASVLLAGILLAGNAAICILSFWKGSREFGRLELFCLGMLAVSGIVWIVFDAPLLNLGIGLFAHLIGALPTYKRVLRDPGAESTAFWSLFFVASVFSIAASYGKPLGEIVFPIYFALFDGSLFLLSLRKHARAAKLEK